MKNGWSQATGSVLLYSWLGGRKDIRPIKTHKPLIPKGSILEQAEEENEEEQANQVHLEDLFNRLFSGTTWISQHQKG